MKISLITATYNSGTTIGDTLRSVAAQSHPHVEHIVIDGASTDDTLEVIREHRQHAVRVVSERDQGIYDALNKGISLAAGDVVGFLHADDVFADQDVLYRVSRAFANSSIDAVYGDLVYVDNHIPPRVVRYWKAGMFDPKKLAWGWMPPHPTFYVRRSIYQTIGTFDVSFRIAADYDLMLRLLRRGTRIAYIPRVLVKMRWGGASNKSLKNLVQKSREDYRALRINGVGGIGSLICKNLSKAPQFLLRR